MSASTNRPRGPYCIPEAAGDPYRPSNGTEGMEFEGAFCDTCFYYVQKREGYGDCTRGILVRAHGFDIDEPGYPKQWVYDAEGVPTCTAWRPKRDVPFKTRALEWAAYYLAMRK